MHFSTRWSLTSTMILLCVSSIVFAARSEELTPKSFMSEMNMSMMDMDAAMAIHPSGDVDRDFVGMMKPHHQGAIDMAQLELRYGRSEQLKRIAQEIIVDQEQEIVAMDRALHPIDAHQDQQ